MNDTTIPTTHTCCLCDKQFTGWGNNPQPFEGDTCCNECNAMFVIPARLGLAGVRRKEDT